MIELLHMSFMQNAVLASVFGGVCLSAIGVCVTLMEIPFLGICMSHSAFLGAIVGLTCGFNPLLGALLACGLTGLLVGPIADHAGTSSNNILGIIFSAAMGLAFLLLARLPGPKSEAMNLIWGSILTISRTEVAVLGAITAAVVLLLAVFYKEVRAVLFNREIAAASGIADGVFYYGIIVISGLVVSASLNIVGGLLIASLLVNPANAANQLCTRLWTLFVVAALIAVGSCLIGLALSYCFEVPTGAVIVLVSSAAFLAAFIFSPRRRHSGADKELP